jgi:hypothetical protein
MGRREGGRRCLVSLSSGRVCGQILAGLPVDAARVPARPYRAPAGGTALSRALLRVAQPVAPRESAGTGVGRTRPGGWRPQGNCGSGRSAERPSLRLLGLLDLAVAERSRMHLLASGIVAQLKHVAGPGAGAAIGGHAEAEHAVGRAPDDLLRGRALARLRRLVKVMSSAVTTRSIPCCAADTRPTRGPGPPARRRNRG